MQIILAFSPIRSKKRRSTILLLLLSYSLVSIFVGSGGVSYGMKAMVNLCLGMLKLMKGKYVSQKNGLKYHGQERTCSVDRPALWTYCGLFFLGGFVCLHKNLARCPFVSFVHFFIGRRLNKSSRSPSLVLMPSVSDHSLVSSRSCGSLSIMD